MINLESYRVLACTFEYARNLSQRRNETFTNDQVDWDEQQFVIDILTLTCYHKLVRKRMSVHLND